MRQEIFETLRLGVIHLLPSQTNENSIAGH